MKLCGHPEHVDPYLDSSFGWIVTDQSGEAWLPDEWAVHCAAYRYETSEERRAAAKERRRFLERERRRRQYHSDPEFRRRTLERNEANRQKNRHVA